MTYSIVISSYNYGHLAAHCIETVLGQYKKFDKIFFVDDGAQDCYNLQFVYPEIEFVLRPTNIGTIKNFQDMLDRVDTEYCMFVGADNWLRSDALHLLSISAEMENSDIVTYDMLLTGTEKDSRVKYHKSEMSRHQGDYWWVRNHKHHGSMLYRTKLAKQVGGYTKYNDSHQTLEDLGLWEKMVRAGAKVSYVNQPLLYYRHHRENSNKY